MSFSLRVLALLLVLPFSFSVAAVDSAPTAQQLINSIVADATADKTTLEAKIKSAIESNPSFAAAIASGMAKAFPADAAVITATAITAAPDKAEEIIIAVTDQIVALSDDDEAERNARLGIANESSTYTYTTDEDKRKTRRAFTDVVSTRVSAGGAASEKPLTSLFRGVSSPN